MSMMRFKIELRDDKFRRDFFGYSWKEKYFKNIAKYFLLNEIGGFKLKIV